MGWSGTLDGPLVSPMVLLRALKGGKCATSETFYAEALVECAKRGVLVSRRAGSVGSLPPALLINVSAAQPDNALRQAVEVAVDVLRTIDHPPFRALTD